MRTAPCTSISPHDEHDFDAGHGQTWHCPGTRLRPPAPTPPEPQSAPEDVRLSEEERDSLHIDGDPGEYEWWASPQSANEHVAAVERIVRAHVAKQIAPLVDAARAEAWDEGWNTAVDSDGYPGDINPYRERAERETP